MRRSSTQSDVLILQQPSTYKDRFAWKYKPDVTRAQIPLSGNGWSYVADDFYYFACRPIAGHGLDSLLIVVYSHEEPLFDGRVIDLVLGQEAYNATPDFTLIGAHGRNMAWSGLV